MLFRRAAQVVTILLVLGAVGLAVWFWKTQHRFYSSPSLVRTNGNELYIRMRAPAGKLPDFPTNYFSSIDVQRTTNQIVVSVAERQSAPADGDYQPLTIHQARGAEPIHIDDGVVRLAYLGVAQARPMTNFHYLQVKAKYFTPDGQPVAEDALKTMPDYMQTLQWDGSFPAFQFVFIHSNISNVKTLNFHAFDARTQSKLTRGYSSSWFTNGFYYGSDLQLWHQTPVELAVTVATGPIVTNTMPMKEGEEIAFPEGRLKLVLVSTQDLGGWSSQSDGRTNTISFNLGRNDSYWAKRTTTSFLFYAWPTGFAMPIDIEFVGANGKTIAGSGPGSSGQFVTMRAEAKVDEIKEVRVKYYSRKHRLIFTIPELPGLPEENRGVENLFEVKIPYTYFRYEYDFQEVVSRSLQMSAPHFALTFPNGYFPTFRTNTTPRELFLEMEKMLSNKDQQLVADPVKNEIRPRKHPVQAFIEMVKAKLGM